MQAIQIKAPGGLDTLECVDLPDPGQPGPGEIRVRLHGGSLNYHDYLVCSGATPAEDGRIPLADGAGIVEAVGEGVKGVAKGDRVIAVPGWGGLVERLAVRAETVIPIPEAMSFEEAAALIMTYGTSYYALKDRAQLKAGETLLVLGAAGGVGAAAVELGKAMGARVIAAASSAEKLEVAKAAGADELINYSEVSLKDAVKELTNGQGADVIYDPVGGDLFDQAVRSINWKGRLLVVGFASGRIPEFPINLALLKGSSIVGVFWGAFAAREPQANLENFQQLFAWHSEGKLKPLVSQTFELNEYEAALDILSSRKAVGKVVVKTR